MSDGGKGSKPRPFSVTQEEYDNRWNEIFARPHKSGTDNPIDFPKENLEDEESKEVKK